MQSMAEIGVGLVLHQACSRLLSASNTRTPFHFVKSRLNSKKNLSARTQKRLPQNGMRLADAFFRGPKSKGGRG
jgi:hypothetical protein